MPSEEQREYWRLAQRKHRIKQDFLKQAPVFEPHLTKFELCSLCRKWHPTEAILPTGDFVWFSLDSFHSQSTLDSWKRESAAGDQVIDRLDQCAKARMQIYPKETYEIALQNCKILMEDPLYRHFPPGLIQPAQIDTKPWISKDPSVKALGQCFTRKMNRNPSMDPEKAVEECTSELRSTEQGKDTRMTVGDLFGKTKAEIAAMTKKKKDPRLTVGDLYGKNKKEILAFQNCVKQKMAEGMTQEEAEEVCEPLGDVTVDRKLEPAEGVAGQTHMS